MDYLKTHPDAKQLYEEQMNQMYEDFSHDDVKETAYGEYENVHRDDFTSTNAEDVSHSP